MSQSSATSLGVKFMDLASTSIILACRGCVLAQHGKRKQKEQDRDCDRNGSREGVVPLISSKTPTRALLSLTNYQTHVLCINPTSHPPKTLSTLRLQGACLCFLSSSLLPRFFALAEDNLSHLSESKTTRNPDLFN